MAHTGLHQVSAASNVFGYNVANVVHHIGVIATAANHGVCTAPAIQHIIAAGAVNQIGHSIAGAVNISTAG